MTASATSSASSGTSMRDGLGGRIGFVVLLVAALVLLAYVAGGSRAGDPLDPDSTQPDGARGLVVLLEELGAEVEVSAEVPEPGDGDVALVLLDQLTDQQEDELVAWTRGGGRLVVADPASALAPLAQPPDLDSITGLLEPEQCDVGPLEQLDQLEVPFAARYEVGDGEGTRSCYGDGELAFVVSTPQGGGVATSLGGAGGFTNDLLDEGDNAPLAVALLSPTPGTSVQIVTAGEGEGGGGAGGGDASTSELVGSRVLLALLQMAVAFVVYAVWRAIRLGKPVGEPQPVQVEGSELVAAVGRLLQQNRSPQAAADLLRRDLRHTLEDRLGVPPDLPPDVAVDLVVDRTGLDPRTVAVAVEATHVQDEGDLVEVAHAIDLIRAEVLHGRRT
jgi:hypothetical protein